MPHATDRSADRHSLGEVIAREDLDLDQRVRRTLRRAPFLVIAIAVHVILGGLMGLMYFQQQGRAKETTMLQVSTTAETPPVLEDLAPPPEPAAVTPVDIPEPSPVDVESLEFAPAEAADTVFNPAGDREGAFGLFDGTDDAAIETLTPSSGGKGLPAAIGLGSGSAPGGGAPRGDPFGRGLKTGRRDPRVRGNPGGKNVDDALDWLARHQAPDGSWDPSGYVGACDSRRGAACDGRGSSAHVAGLTGLALLCYLGQGIDGAGAGRFDLVVRSGLKWLRQNQDAEGCFGPRADNRFTYDHACATIAMCEAYLFTRAAAWKRPAQNALDFAAACQNPYGAWRYGKQPGDNDSSVTGWMIMALKSGKDAGLTVSDRAIKEGIALIDSLTDRETGRTGYTKPGERPVRPEGGAAERWPAAETEALTAVAMCSRIFGGTAEKDLGLMKAGQELLEKRLPVWDEAKGSIDMYYWYYGTLAMFQMGGPAWDRWNRSLKPAVIDTQRKDGCLAGSWDPKDAWSDDGGRIYSTALMTLCLEVYYRFPKVFTGRR